ncbi:RNase adapter RapZ [Alkalispirochaeta alkalica]|uniref:RNase adapter RapZ n=1 Tax=Alkalispirochaeta alkalica TaxID=46356 RepID=UPI00035E91EA|nr:RNase adapter RapZ [Alkalispirochaeta alkalica]
MPGVRSDGAVEEIILLLGHGGSGRTEAIRAFDLLGIPGVDNLPPQLLEPFAGFRQKKSFSEEGLCVVALDMADDEAVSAASEALDKLENASVPYRILFLECQPAIAKERIQGKSSYHPSAGTDLSALIQHEKQMLQPLRFRASEVLDTSQLSIYDLQERLSSLIKGTSFHRSIFIDIFSFGFKYGPFLPADIVFDVRFIENPYYVPHLRDLTGLDRECAEYVMEQPNTTFFVETLVSLLSTLAPSYSRLGKARLRVGIGCTGGQHRSVAVAERIGAEIDRQGFRVAVHHRERGTVQSDCTG